jgi:hypothetical protein
MTRSVRVRPEAERDVETRSSTAVCAGGAGGGEARPKRSPIVRKPDDIVRIPDDRSLIVRHPDDRWGDPHTYMPGATRCEHAVAERRPAVSEGWPLAIAKRNSSFGRNDGSPG